MIAGRGRPAAGVGDADRRHVPDRHGPFREAQAGAPDLPIWEPDLCIDCGKCAIVCPHAAIRMKAFVPSALDRMRPTASCRSPSAPANSPDHLLTIQVAPDDCTGCGVCVDVCPAKDKTAGQAQGHQHGARRRAPRRRTRAVGALHRRSPNSTAQLIAHDSVKNSQLLAPLFEFSGACAGCGETPYLKLLTQLFGDRLVVANATGCSSIYGGNLPTTPWAKNANGLGPAWSNSLFEDNAEFGYGMRLGIEHHQREARRLLEGLADVVGRELAAGVAGRLGADRVRGSSRAGAGGRSCATVSSTSSRAPTPSSPTRPGTCSRSPMNSCGRARGSSVATAGRTTSASAASTTCSAAVAT